MAAGHWTELVEKGFYLQRLYSRDHHRLCFFSMAIQKHNRPFHWLMQPALNQSMVASGEKDSNPVGFVLYVPCAWKNGWNAVFLPEAEGWHPSFLGTQNSVSNQNNSLPKNMLKHRPNGSISKLCCLSVNRCNHLLLLAKLWNLQ